jgi:hypothetical protein
MENLVRYIIRASFSQERRPICRKNPGSSTGPTTTGKKNVPFTLPPFYNFECGCQLFLPYGIPSLLIRFLRVLGLIPRICAAPPGPLIFPPALSKAWLMWRAFNSSSGSRDRFRPASGGASRLLGTGAAKKVSNERTPPRCWIKARSIMFPSSRTLPGQ